MHLICFSKHLISTKFFFIFPIIYSFVFIYTFAFNYLMNQNFIGFFEVFKKDYCIGHE